jgi:cell division protein FtsW (lipid II flippase)
MRVHPKAYFQCAFVGSALPERLVFVGFADDRRLVGLVFVLFVFVLIIIVVVRISRRCRLAYVSENLLDTTCPLLFQTSMKL